LEKPFLDIVLKIIFYEQFAGIIAPAKKYQIDQNGFFYSFNSKITNNTAHFAQIQGLSLHNWK
jgi:hypothetical protein